MANYIDTPGIAAYAALCLTLLYSGQGKLFRYLLESLGRSQRTLKKVIESCSGSVFFPFLTHRSRCNHCIDPIY